VNWVQARHPGAEIGANDEGSPLQPVRGPGVLEIVDLPDPHAGPGQIRVAVHPGGVNPTDWKLRKGLTGGELPQTTGREVAGVVDEVGIGSAAVQLAVARGARVIGTASPANYDYLRSLGAEPVATALAWPGGLARSRPTASMWRSTSPGAACCPSSSSSRAARSTS
jgi:D-arabinose 1-dehydrogenase-like Zn-dependent alcohol dehydrogenase